MADAGGSDEDRESLVEYEVHAGRVTVIGSFVGRGVMKKVDVDVEMEMVVVHGVLSLVTEPWSLAEAGQPTGV